MANAKIKHNLRKLDKVLEDCKTLLIVAHDYPDPDALASALLLSHLVGQRHGIGHRIAYGGLITRAENRALVQQLRVKLTQTGKIAWNRYSHIALVDTQPSFGNNSLPEDINPVIVFDHHPKKMQKKVPFSDIRTEYGATAILLAEYLKAADIELTVDLATAVIYAIDSETENLGRDTSKSDIDTFLEIYPKANQRKLAKINNPNLPKDYFVTLHKALENARVFRHFIHVHLGPVASPEFVPQVADLLLRHERITWAIATGRFNDQLFVSLRCGHSKANAGETLKQIVGKLGRAGGHSRIAGGQIPYDAEKNGSWESLEDKVIGQFLHKLRIKKEIEWKPMLFRDQIATKTKE